MRERNSLIFTLGARHGASIQILEGVWRLPCCTPGRGHAFASTGYRKACRQVALIPRKKCQHHGTRTLSVTGRRSQLV